MDVFYDFDGTLFDTYPAMVAAFVEVGRQFGKKVNPEQTYLQMRQGSLGSTIKSFAMKHDLNEEKFDLDFRAVEKELLSNSRPFLNVKETLAQTIGKGERNYLLTHRNQAAIDLLDQYQLTSFFTDFVTGDMTFPRKPNPASLEYLIEKNHVNKKTAFMVGDRNLDIDAAHNAGIKGVLFDPDNIINVTSHPEFESTNFLNIANYLLKK